MARKVEQTDELAQALGEISETVEVKASKKAVAVTVTPFRLRQFSRVLKCVQRLRDTGVIDRKALKKVKEILKAEETEETDEVEGAEKVKEAVKNFDMVKMVLDGGDEVINIIQVAVDGQLQAHEVNNLSLVDGARLASAVFAVNVDFFYQNKEAIQGALAPAVRAVETVMEGGLEALGQPPSTGSEEQDTP